MGAVRPGPCMREASDLSSALSRKVLCVWTPPAGGVLLASCRRKPLKVQRASPEFLTVIPQAVEILQVSAFHSSSAFRG